jgi:shikimate dehydrogenase
VPFGHYISNPLNIGPGQRFAAILGANPSQGARSPALWNAAFTAHGGNETMVPMDVDGENLVPLLGELDADIRFIGGAVAVPHKEALSQWLGERLTKTARQIGAVNCLFRRDGQGPLWGTNTDGEGALVCIEAVCGPLKDLQVVQLGVGGAGRAVAAYLADAGAQLTLCVRDLEKISDFATHIGARTVAWDDRAETLSGVVLAVNTTSLGGVAGNMADQTPLNGDAFKLLPDDAWAYDIIYDPCPTRFLVLAAEHGLKTGDGRCMNLEQAVLGFGYAADEPKGRDATRAAMEAAKAGLESG